MRFGIGVREITPQARMRMYGYAARQDVFDGVNDPLTFTALVLEDGGNRAVLGAADLGSFPNDEGVAALRERMGKAAGCPADHVMLNASHTHGGPALPRRSGTEPPGNGAAEQYRDRAFDQMAAAVEDAAGKLQDGSLWHARGKTRLPMNRRPERNGEVVNAPNPSGGTDDRLDVLLVRDAENRPAAVGIRVSCHPVATGAQHLITADYVGAWRAAFSKAFGPHVAPFFLQGAGADARPRHAADGEEWRMVSHADLPGMGDELLAETLSILATGKQTRLDPLALQGTVNTVAAPCEERYTTREAFEAIRSESGLLGRYAERAIQRLDDGDSIPDHVDFDVQTLWLNKGLALIGLNVEPLYALGAKVEQSVAPREGLLLGYNNGCLGYTPDREEMARGGYETSSYLYSVWTGPLAPGIEDVFASGVAPYQEA